MSKILLLLALAGQSISLAVPRIGLGPHDVIYPIDLRPSQREWLVNDTQQKKLRVVLDTRQGLCWGDWFNPVPQDGAVWVAYLDTSEFPSRVTLQSPERYVEVALDIPPQCR